MTQPRVRVFMQAAGKAPLKPQDLDLLVDTDAIIAAESPAAWGFENWEAQLRVLAGAPRSRPVDLSTDGGATNALPSAAL